MKEQYLFTSESVTAGHPDRLCDSVCDAVLDRYLQQDPYARLVAECALSKNVLFLAARFAAEASVDIPEVARQVIGEVGYREEDFDPDECTVVSSFNPLPSDKRWPADETGLSDAELEQLPNTHQVTVFGFACRQTPEYLPLPIVLANRLARRLTAARREGLLPGVSPDCTVQVGVAFQGRTPVSIHSLTLIAGHEGGPAGDARDIRGSLIQHVVDAVFQDQAIRPDQHTQIILNPEGSFRRSGPAAHSGMTGRKTSADTYGGYARHCGAALSGKDPARIDRIGVYAARYAAKNLVAAGLAEECEVQLSYTFGQSRPASVQVNSFGGGARKERELQRLLEQHFDFRLGAIIRDFDLRHQPALSRHGFYHNLPAQGHFGSEHLPWEALDKVALLQS